MYKSSSVLIICCKLHRNHSQISNCQARGTSAALAISVTLVTQYGTCGSERATNKSTLLLSGVILL